MESGSSAFFTDTAYQRQAALPLCWELVEQLMPWHLATAENAQASQMSLKTVEWKKIAWVCLVPAKGS